MTIEMGSFVTIDYRLTDQEGALIEDTGSDEPVTYRQGEEEILPSLEAALMGHNVDDKFTVTLSIEDAYGPYDPEGLMTIPRAQLPDEYVGEIGETLVLGLDEEEAEEHGVDDDEIEVHVLELNPDEIVVDANHPLAGKSLTFDIVVRDIS